VCLCVCVCARDRIIRWKFLHSAISACITGCRTDDVTRRVADCSCICCCNHHHLHQYKITCWLVRCTLTITLLFRQPSHVGVLSKQLKGSIINLFSAYPSVCLKGIRVFLKIKVLSCGTFNLVPNCDLSFLLRHVNHRKCCKRSSTAASLSHWPSYVVYNKLTSMRRVAWFVYDSWDFVCYGVEIGYIVSLRLIWCRIWRQIPISISGYLISIVVL